MSVDERAPDGAPRAAPLRAQELRAAQAYPHPVGPIELVETNTSLIALTGEYAYKIKKPVALEFLDTTTLARRRFLCEEELRLNVRLAPQLYLDVVPIARTPAGLRVGAWGEIVEYAVRMRQFDRTLELSALLERDAVQPAEIAALAVRIARFHEDAARSAARPDFANTAQMRAAVLGNLATLLAHVDGAPAAPELGTLIDWTHDVLHGSARRFEAREADGFVRECHGDLHARNVVRWRGELTPFDCLEFDPRLRWIDVMNDLAFMVMDLTARNRGDLAAVFLNAYLEKTGDYAGVRLLPFYAVYRALVRAMVDALAAEGDAGRRAEHAARSRARIRAAAQFMHPPRPVLVLMHGPSGSGKSWLSERLVPSIAAVRVRSDVERKRIAATASSAAEGLYTPAFNALTYAHLLECAAGCLQGGVSTIVDAAALRRTDRELFRNLAAAMRVPFTIVSCDAARGVLAERILRRQRAAADPSDAGVDVLDVQLASMEPLGEAERRYVVEVATADPRAPDVARTAILAARDAAAP